MSRSGRQIASLGLALALALPAWRASAQDVPPPPVAQNVEIVEHLGAPLPLDAELTDQLGNKVRLGDYFKSGKPVLLSLAYFHCPMLCSLLLGGEAKVMRELELGLGKDYQAVTVSFDSTDNPAGALRKQQNYLQSAGKPDAKDSWAFLTTPDKETIRRITEAVGFKFFYDEQTKQFAHAAVLFVITPDGRISRYLYDVSFQPKQLKLAMVEASAGTIGNTLDKVLLQCYQYDPASRKYHLAIRWYFRAGGLLALLMMGGLIGYLIKNDSKYQSKRKWAS